MAAALFGSSFIHWENKFAANSMFPRICSLLASKYSLSNSSRDVSLNCFSASFFGVFATSLDIPVTAVLLVLQDEKDKETNTTIAENFIALTIKNNSLPLII